MSALLAELWTKVPERFAIVALGFVAVPLVVWLELRGSRAWRKAVEYARQEAERRRMSRK